MAESWVRLWSDMTTDPKWQTIARKSGKPRYLVIALFAHLMLEANAAEDRGSVDAVVVEDVASALDCDEADVMAIMDAMQGRVIVDGRLAGWERFRAPANLYRQSAEVWMITRQRIFGRDDYTCQYCGARGVPLECDHVVPIAQGGSNSDENLVTACRSCNRAKGARTPEQWGGA